jgi:hypothetical protein
MDSGNKMYFPWLVVTLKRLESEPKPFIFKHINR